MFIFLSKYIFKAKFIVLILFFIKFIVLNICYDFPKRVFFIGLFDIFYIKLIKNIRFLEYFLIKF